MASGNELVKTNRRPKAWLASLMTALVAIALNGVERPAAAAELAARRQCWGHFFRNRTWRPKFAEVGTLGAFP
jgi:hypothetical protein